MLYLYLCRCTAKHNETLFLTGTSKYYCNTHSSCKQLLFFKTMLCFKVSYGDILVSLPKPQSSTSEGPSSLNTHAMWESESACLNLSESRYSFCRFSFLKS